MTDRPNRKTSHTERYRNDPEYRAMIRERQKAARQARKKADPERFARLEREKERRKRQRIMADPERHAKKLLARKIRHERQMSDPAERERKNANRREWLAQRKAAKASTISRTDPLEALRRSLMSNEIWSSVQAYIPSGYSAEFRDDLASEAVVALLSGDAASPEDAVKMGRLRLSRAISNYGLISLDQPRFDGASWYDKIAA